MYIVDGKHYSQGELLRFSTTQIKAGQEEWSRKVFTFIREWLSSTPQINLKTSGTTGKPSEIQVTKEKLRASARATRDFFGLTPEMSCLLCLSPDYIAGKMMIVRALETKMNLILTKPRANPLTGLAIPIDFTAMVPYQANTILAENPDSLALLHLLLIGGSAISPECEEQLSAVPCEVYETFGMTETLTHFAVRKIGTERDRVFHTLPGVTVAETDDRCLMVTAPWFPISPFITRDIVKLLSPQSFQWIGRRDYIINTGGVKVSPEHVERMIAPRFRSTSFFVAGLPDEKLGERIGLFIEDPGVNDIEVLTVTPAMKKGIFNLLTDYEIPKEIITLKRFIRTENGKIRRHETIKLFI